MAELVDTSSRSPILPSPTGRNALRSDGPAVSWIFGGYLVCGIAAFFLYFLLGIDQQLVVYDFFGIYAFVAVLLGVAIHRPPVKLPWYVLSAALLMLVAGDVLLNRYELFFGRPAGYPDLPDAFFLGGNFAVVVALGLIIRLRLGAKERSSFIDAMIIATAGAVLSWIFLMVPHIQDQELTNAQRIVSMTYPVADVLMLVMLARLMLGGGLKTTAFWLIAGALSAGMAADTAFAEISLRNGEPPLRGHWVDAGWIVWYILWGATALHPSMRTLTLTGPVLPPMLTGRRLLVLISFALIVPMSALFEAVRHNDTNGAVIAIGSILLFLLVLIRMSGLIRAVERARDGMEASLERERILRTAAATFVAATDRSEIYAAAMGAVRGIAGGDVRVAVVEGTPGAMRIVAGADFDEDSQAFVEFDPNTLSRLTAAMSVIVYAQDDWGVSTALRLRPGESARLAALVIRGELRGAVMAAGGDLSSGPDPRWLEGLSSNLALALERAKLADDLHQRRSEERFQSLVRNASDIIVICDQLLKIRYVSPSVERILGYGPEVLIGNVFTSLVHPDDLQAVTQTHSDITTLTGATRALEYRILHLDGTWHHIEAIKTNLLHDESINGLVINIRDISERKVAEERLEYQAFHDQLTGLPNRALFMDRLNHSIARAKRRDETTGLLFLDLDRFKVVNDSLGHEAGDQLLQIVAQRIRKAIRAGDTAGRLGGDEFTVLLEDLADAEDAIAIADRLSAEVNRSIVIDGREVFVSTSVGIAVCRNGQASALDMLREADIAMYQAKSQAKGGYALFDAEMGTAALRRLELETDLRAAIDQQQFELHYQPALDLQANRVSTMEALVRWRKPDGSLVPPIEFIPLAEETGMIVDLGLWVLREACRQQAEWRERFGPGCPSISVNLSARQLLHPTIVADVHAALLDFAVDPASLILEITETFAVEDAEANRATLDQFKAIGARLAIDDFGSGYSSLSYLRRLPFDLLKIDRAFVKALGTDPDDTLIISAVSDLAHNLGMIVVAEGLEDQNLVDRVRALGCDLGQGYFFSRPLPAELAGEYIAKDRAQQPDSVENGAGLSGLAAD